MLKSGSEPVEVVDQLAKSTGAAPVETEQESRQIPEGRLIELFFQRTAQLKRSLDQEIVELFLNLVELFGGDGVLQSHGQLPADEPNGVIAAIEPENMVDSRFGRVCDRE